MNAAKVKKIVSRTLVIGGALLVVIGLGFEMINFPWRTILMDMGFPISQELKDPAPLPQNLIVEQTDVSSAPEKTPDQMVVLPGEPDPTAAELRPELGLEPVGILQYGRLDVSENIVEGTDDELLYAIGHVRGTALPGEPGNCVLAGHREYAAMHPFKHLDMARIGDIIRIKYNDKVYTYEVFDKFLVDPSEIWVLAPQAVAPEMVTLMTCSSAPLYLNRVIVRCRPVETTES